MSSILVRPGANVVIPGIDQSIVDSVVTTLLVDDPMPREMHDLHDLARWFRVVDRWRTKHGCSRVLECGGFCRLDRDHAPPCLCVGDLDGPGSCPA
jgi:hypothetical protein